MDTARLITLATTATPTVAFADTGGDGYLVPAAIAALGLHGALLLHLLRTRAINTCYRISYVSIFLMVAITTWLLAVLAWDLAGSPGVAAAILLLPAAVWLLLLLRGPHRGLSCTLPDGRGGSGPC